MDILVVDDDTLVVNVVQDFLRHQGFNVCAVYDAETAIRFLENQTFDVLFCDIYLSGPNADPSGYRVLEAAKHKNDDTLVYLWSAFVNVEDIPAELSFDGILAKPFSLKRLSRLIKSIRKKTTGHAV